MITPQGRPTGLIHRQTGQTFPLDQELITIGRKSGNTIVLTDDLKVSRHHATIAREDEAYIINDVGSSNGTFVNETRLTAPHPLQPGDLIRIGETVFEVSVQEDETEPSLSPAPATAAADKDETWPLKPAGLETILSLAAGQPDISDNPYVGPRTFSQEESDRFFGREREARELLALVISNRLVLFYAQSGAGKSSLINARLIPQLRAAGQAVLPVGRVSGAMPEEIDQIENIYIFNLLTSLDESDGDPRRFTRMPLSEFLTHLTSMDSRHYYYDDALEMNDLPLEDEFEETPYVLIIDQFEEILATHPERWQEREQFFEQLAQALAADPLLWVVLSLREDYVAPLDPYTPLLPDGLRARFYMQRMEYEAALAAVKKPAQKFGRPFGPGVAENLVDNLRQIRVHGLQGPDRLKTQAGQFVEPVQLQVVCYQLWENMKDRPAGEITGLHLRELGDVDVALAQFYEQAIADVVANTAVTEIELRRWFETQLITEAYTRGTVYRAQTDTAGIPNQAVDLLAARFLLRSEARTGGTWYELVHDRFIAPIIQANQAWRLEQPLIQMAQEWVEADRSPAKLLEGQRLKETLTSNWRGLGPLVEEFLTASQAAQRAKEEAERIEKEQQQQREIEQQRHLLEVQTQAAAKLRRRAWLLGGFVIAALLMAAVALTSSLWANRAAVAAQAERAKAIAAQQTAQAEATAAAANANVARDVLAGQKATQTAMARMDLMVAEEAEDLSTQAVRLKATQEALRQTATAEYISQLPTPTPVPPPPTATPTGAYTPLPTEIPTATPTMTATPTPDRAATGTAEALEAELNRIQAQQENLTVSPPGETPGEACPVEIQGPFRSLWREFQERLGCPLQAEPIGGFFAEQPFERGFMIWSQILDLFFVTVGDSREGTWQMFTKEQVDAFSDSPAVPCAIKPPPNFVQPVRGFGTIWCAREDIRRAIGFGRRPEYGVENALIQEFENGFIIQDSQDRPYILFSESASYLRAP